MDYTLRLMRPEDIQQCIDIVELNYGEKYSTIENELTSMFKLDLWVRPEYHVIEVDNKIVSFGGYSLTTIDYNCYGIFWINTHPEHVKNGYAKQIVNSIIDAIKEKNSNKAWIILSCKENLKQFYEQFGFKILSIRPEKGGYMMGLNINETNLVSIDI